MSKAEVMEQYRSFFQNSPDAYLFCNQEGKISAWNNGCRYLFGYNPEEIGNFSLFTLIPAENLTFFSSMFEQIKKNRIIFFNVPCVTKEGRVFQGHVTGGPITDNNDGTFYFTFADSTNIEKYRSRLQSVSMFPDYTGDIIMEWEKEKGITYFNQAVSGILSVAGNGRINPEKILPKNYEKQMHRLAGTPRTLREVETDYSGRLFSYTYIPYDNDDAKVLILGRDVTDRRSLEKEVDTAYDRTRNILDLIEGILRQLRFSDMDEELDVRPAVGLFLREEKDQTSRNPNHILIASENEEGMLEGRLYHKKLGEVTLKTPSIFFHPVEIRRMISERSDLIFRNQSDEDEGRWQGEPFPGFITENIPSIDNFISCKISGEPGGYLIAFNYPQPVNKYDSETIRGLSVATGALFSTRSQFAQKVEAQFTLIAKMAELIEERDRETGEHLKRVSSYCRIIADEMSKKPRYKDVITRDFIKKLYRSAPLHDLGKVGVPDAILQKPGKLDVREYEIMQKHTLVGGKLLEGPRFLDMAREIAYFHHEKFDGSGYPYGIKGYEIPLSARIVAIADVYDAMTSDRVYKEAFSHDRTKKLISICSGGHFDPDVVEAFLNREQDFVKVREMYR